jgi:hypothetical protein
MFINYDSAYFSDAGHQFSEHELPPFFINLRCFLLLASHIMILFTLLFASIAWCNVEKTIFLGPPPHSALSLCLDQLSSLTSQAESIRTSIPVRFPTAENPKGTTTWLLLDDLTPSKRYEARVCWAAIVRLFVCCLKLVPWLTYMVESYGL